MFFDEASGCRKLKAESSILWKSIGHVSSPFSCLGLSQDLRRNDSWDIFSLRNFLKLVITNIYTKKLDMTLKNCKWMTAREIEGLISWWKPIIRVAGSVEMRRTATVKRTVINPSHRTVSPWCLLVVLFAIISSRTDETTIKMKGMIQKVNTVR